MEELKFEEGTLLVIEVKTTLGKSRTPGFLKTQASGGKHDVERIRQLILTKKQGWDIKTLSDLDPMFSEKLTSVHDSFLTGKISYLHAQVFFDSAGNPNRLTGNSAGVQINHWN